MDYDIIYLGVITGLSIVPPLFLVSQLKQSLKTATRAKYALDMIALGDNTRKYHNDIQDAKIDGLAGILIGGRKALFRAAHLGKTRE